MDATRCPDRTELEGFVVGSLAGPALARVAGHVEGCGACELTLQALDRLADPLLSELRRLGQTDGPKPDPVPDELIAAVRSACARGGEPAWDLAQESGRRLGKFELAERLGAGPYGTVFRARRGGRGPMGPMQIR